MKRNNSLKNKCLMSQSGANTAFRHVHEFLGSTRLAGVTVHNHRFAGVSSQAIPIGRNHIHVVSTNTDFAVAHLHRVKALTGLAIPVGRGRHVHFARGTTTFDAGHDHGFAFAALIEDPLDL